MEETFARTLQFTLAGLAAFGVALWFALAVWTFRDIARRSSSLLVQVLATLVVVLGYIPGVAIYLLLRPRETVEQRFQREIEESYLSQELGSVPICPNCARPVRDEFIFCPDCGTSLRRTCVSCGRLVDADWKLCAFCGHDLPGGGTRSVNGRERTPVRVRDRQCYSESDDREIDLDVDVPLGDEGQQEPQRQSDSRQSSD